MDDAIGCLTIVAFLTWIGIIDPVLEYQRGMKRYGPQEGDTFESVVARYPNDIHSLTYAECSGQSYVFVRMPYVDSNSSGPATYIFDGEGNLVQFFSACEICSDPCRAISRAIEIAEKKAAKAEAEG